MAEPAPLPLGPVPDTSWRELGLKDYMDSLQRGEALLTQSKEYTASFGPGLIQELESQTTKALDTVAKTVDLNLSGVESRLDSILDALKSKSDAASTEAEQTIRRVIDFGKGAVETNIVPALGVLDKLTQGIGSLADLPIASATAIVGSIPYSLEFLQAARLDRVGDLVGKVGSTLLDIPGQVVEGVNKGLSAVSDGLLDGLRAILRNIESLILDPIAALLRAILAAILGLPKAAADGLLESLLEELPGEASS